MRIKQAIKIPVTGYLIIKIKTLFFHKHLKVFLSINSFLYLRVIDIEYILEK
jgi:hypothetical protein